MTVRDRSRGTLAVFLSSVLENISYRTPRMVKHLRVLPEICGETGFYVCPRCDISLDREFMSYCNNCGQKLDWRNYLKAKIIYPSEKYFENA